MNKNYVGPLAAALLLAAGFVAANLGGCAKRSGEPSPATATLKMTHQEDGVTVREFVDGQERFCTAVIWQGSAAVDCDFVPPDHAQTTTVTYDEWCPGCLAGELNSGAINASEIALDSPL